jgi:hypothetical protein
MDCALREFGFGRTRVRALAPLRIEMQGAVVNAVLSTASSTRLCLNAQVPHSWLFDARRISVCTRHQRSRRHARRSLLILNAVFRHVKESWLALLHVASTSLELHTLTSLVLDIQPAWDVTCSMSIETANLAKSLLAMPALK